MDIHINIRLFLFVPFQQITVDQFAKLGFPGAGDLAVMFDFYQQGKADRDIALTKELDPTTLSFDDWVKENKDALDALYV